MEKKKQQQTILEKEEFDEGEEDEKTKEVYGEDDNYNDVVQLPLPRDEEDDNKVEANNTTTTTSTTTVDKTTKTTKETAPIDEEDNGIVTSNNNDNTVTAAAASWSSPSPASAAGSYEARLRQHKVRRETNHHKNSTTHTATTLTTTNNNIPKKTNNDNDMTLLSKPATKEESYAVKLRRKMMEERMKGDRKRTDSVKPVKSTVEDDTVSENNDSITSSNKVDVVSSSSLPGRNDEESYTTRLRRKMTTERNQQQSEVENQRNSNSINDNFTNSNNDAARSVTDELMLSANSDVATSVKSHDDEVDVRTPGAFAASGRPIGGMPAWARGDNGLTHRHSNGPSLLSQEGHGEEEEDHHVELEAVIVDKEQEEKEMKEAIQREMADQVVTADAVEKVESPQKRRIRRIICAILAIATVVVITSLTVALTKKDNEEHSTPAPTSNPDPTLKQITEAGVVKCYVVYPSDTDFCRALAAAIFGPVQLEEKMYLLNQSEDWQVVESFAALANGTVDVMFGTPHTMERNFEKDKNTGVGFTLTAPYLYDGLTFFGFPKFVKCADELDTFGNCSDTRICTIQGEENYNFLDMRIPTSAIVPVISFDDMINGLVGGRCNVIGEIYTLISGTAIQFNGHDSFIVGRKMHTKVPLSFVTRDNDPEWSDFVNAVVQSFWVAYTMNITKDTADKFRTTSIFGDEFENMFIDAIGEAGNAKEGLDRHNLTLQPDINQINRNGSTGLIYSLPFGDTQKEGPGPLPGGKLEKILKRGRVLCGIIPNRQGFAHYNTVEQRYSGLDVDYCHSVASGIFRSDRAAVDFVPFDLNNTSNIFEALVNGTIDIAAGVAYTLERDVREPSTGEGFTFSTPYFYDPPEGPLKEALSLVTCQGDPQWSAVVYWIVMATFYAEENNWTQDLSYLMPLVDLLGPYEDHNFKRIFRDAIMIGNYGELYERNVERIIPRSGRNKLNKDPLGPQLNPYIYFDL